MMMIYSWIDCVNQRLDVIVWETHVLRQLDGIVRREVQTSADLQEPLSESIAFWGAIQTHVLLEMQDLNMPPQPGLFQGSIDNLDPGTSVNNRQGLSKVTDKHGSDASEERNILDILTLPPEEVPDCVIDSFWTMTVLHGSFIPYDEL